MSKVRYSDNPSGVMAQTPAPAYDDTDLEQDIVLGNSTHPSSLDRTLLNADQEVLSTLSKHHHQHDGKHTFLAASRSNWSKTYKKLMAKAGNSFAKQGAILPQHVSLKETGSSGVGGSAHDYAYVNGHDGAEDSDSDASVIEIDIRSRPLRHRRREIGKRARKLYGVLLVCLVLFVVWMVFIDSAPLRTISSRSRPRS